MAGMLIMGIDPGTRTTGYGIVRSEGDSLVCVEYGAVQNAAKLTVYECHARIYEGILKLMREYSITAVATEAQFFSKNVRTALRIGEARSVALLPALAALAS